MWARGRNERTTGVTNGVTSMPHKLEYVAEARAPWVKTAPFGLPVVP